MAELVDALVSGTSAREGVEVQVLFAAPKGLKNYTILFSGFAEANHPVFKI